MPLFDKFTARGKRGEARSELESVLDNLENVLNTRRGWGSPLPDYGISTLSEHVSREHVAKAVISEMQECIEKYEPRLRIDSITMDDEATSPFWLAFDLECSLIQASRLVRVSVNTLFGTCQVSREP